MQSPVSPAKKLLQFALFTLGEVLKTGNRKLNRANVSLVQLMFLRHMATRSAESLTMTDIAKWFGHSTAAATGVVDRLEKLGYVERKHAIDDRRKVTVVLLPKGFDLVREFEEEGIVKVAELLGEGNEEPISLPSAFLPAVLA
jgi:DNA-binding MarR family transcriptional regulator